LRKPIIAGNWKMNLLPDQAVALVESLWELTADHDGVEIVVCPPFLDIPAVSEAIKRGDIKIGLAAQNMHWEDSGAFTGEVSPNMLLASGVTHVIIGHSERRQFFRETDQGVNRKVRSALDHGLVPIMCVGETSKQREAGETENAVVKQVERGLFEVDVALANALVIAYEPVWAIGTGKAATVGDAEVVVRMIRRTVSGALNADIADTIRILYGGSVNPENISAFMAKPDIDGALVGGASLKSEDFSRIVRFS
jgi:triosephosphate isomerase